MSDHQSLLDDLRHLRNEVDCRIEHGASGTGHLEYVRNCLDQIMDAHARAYCSPHKYHEIGAKLRETAEFIQKELSQPSKSYLKALEKLADYNRRRFGIKDQAEQ